MRNAQALIQNMIETLGKEEVFAMAKRLNSKPREALTKKQQAFLFAIHMYLLDQVERVPATTTRPKRRAA